MKEKILAMKESAQKLIEAAKDLKEIDDLRVKLLGKKGELTEVLKDMKNLSAEERPEIGKVANEVRDFLTAKIDEKFEELKKEMKAGKIKEETIDITLPGKSESTGRFHPITETVQVVQDIFYRMGFDIADGPEVETEYYNFTALNIPESHPSRDLQDTFYFNPEVLLRTQTSPVQIRYMEDKNPPF